MVKQSVCPAEKADKVMTEIERMPELTAKISLSKVKIYTRTEPASSEKMESG
jgi:hypothetical protein